MSMEQARLNLGRIAANLAGLSREHPRFDEVATKAAMVKPDDFFEFNGDEIEARFVLGEDDADATAGKDTARVLPLRKLAKCVLSLPDCRKLLLALEVLRGSSAQRRSKRFDAAVCDLLKRWGGIDLAVVDSIPDSLVGKLCWRLCETHSSQGDKSGIKAADRLKDIARRKWQGKTWDEIAVELGGKTDALKKANQARQKRLNR